MSSALSSGAAPPPGRAPVEGGMKREIGGDLSRPDMEALIEQYGDYTLRELVLKYVDSEIDRLMRASNNHLQQFSEELLN
ncbi:unnamed protein product [Amoebophrya sp. A25]|nr:unnamed protein product [Amoebophrya sp. A25]|eukprot:GSA25T00004980001.1